LATHCLILYISATERCKWCLISSSFNLFPDDREYLIDLIGNPGFLSEPDSLLNGLSSISVSSPLRPPKHNSVDIADNFKSLAKQYFLDCQSLNLMFNDPAAGIFLHTEQCKIQDLLELSCDIYFIILGTVINLEGSNLGPNTSHGTNSDSQATFPYLNAGPQLGSQDESFIMQRRYPAKISV
jgi:serine/threonine-protein kinase CTR1